MRKYWLMVVTLVLGWTLSAQAQKVLEYTFTRNYQIMEDNSLRDMRTEKNTYYRIAISDDYNHLSFYCPSEDIYFYSPVFKSYKSDDGESLYLHVKPEDKTYMFVINKTGVTNMFFEYKGMILCKSFIE